MISAILSGKKLTVIINGEYHKFHDQTREAVLEMYRKTLEVAKNPTPEAVKELRGILDPSTRVDDVAGLEKDRKGNYFLKGTNVPIPTLLIERVQEYQESGIPVDTLLNFWRLAMANPDPVAREGMFKFAETFGLPITSNGYFIAYKSVMAKGAANLDYARIISHKYLNVLALRKEKISDFVIITRDNLGMPVFYHKKDTYDIIDGEVSSVLYRLFEKEEECKSLVDAIMDDIEIMLLGDTHVDEFKIQVYSDIKSEGGYFDFAKVQTKAVLEEGVLVVTILESSKAPVDDENMGIHTSIQFKGSLLEQYKNLLDLVDSDEESFTDFHSQTMDIRLGKPVTMPREDVDSDPNRSCSAGLHVGSPKYVDRFGHGSSRHVLACLVNPRDVVAVPYDYEWQKMRVCKYYPYAIAELEDGKIKELPSTYVEEDFIDYDKAAIEKELEVLMAKNASELTEEEVAKIDILKRVIQF